MSRSKASWKTLKPLCTKDLISSLVGLGVFSLSDKSDVWGKLAMAAALGTESPLHTAVSHSAQRL